MAKSKNKKSKAQKKADRKIVEDQRAEIIEGALLSARLSYRKVPHKSKKAAGFLFRLQDADINSATGKVVGRNDLQGLVIGGGIDNCLEFIRQLSSRKPEYMEMAAKARAEDLHKSEMAQAMHSVTKKMTEKRKVYKHDGDATANRNLWSANRKIKTAPKKLQNPNYGLNTVKG